MSISDILSRRQPHTVGGNCATMMELNGGKVVEVTAFEPDPVTYRSTYYYNVRTNQLYRKVVTAHNAQGGAVAAHWKVISH